MPKSKNSQKAGNKGNNPTTHKKRKAKNKVSTAAIVTFSLLGLAVALCLLVAFVPSAKVFFRNLVNPPIESKHLYGIDLSRYQNELKWDEIGFYYDKRKDTIVFEANKEKRLPISFVFLKATQGRAYDKTYAEKKENALKHGYKTGAYHILVSDTNIVEQANNFVNIAQLDSSNYPPILDIESNLISRPYSEYRKRALLWLNTVEEMTGGKPLIYCSDKTREQILNTPEFEDYHFWIARYDTTPPKSSDDWLFWQFTEKGRINGYKGKIDVSVWKGKKDELEKWRQSCWHDPKARQAIEEEIDQE